MKKCYLSVSLLSSLFIAGCSATGDGGFLGALNQFSNLVDSAMPFVQESEEWKQYSIDKTAQGVTYHTATTADTQFASKKIESEYPAAIDRLARPFATHKNLQDELDEVNKDYHFTYNKIMTVKDKKSANTIGFCVNYDVNRFENGKPTPADTSGNLEKHFLYVAKDKPLSASTMGEDFIKQMCGVSFYNKYKNPND